MILRGLFLISIPMIRVIRYPNLSAIMVVLDHRLFQLPGSWVIPLLRRTFCARRRLMRLLSGEHLIWKCSFLGNDFLPARRSCTCYLLRPYNFCSAFHPYPFKQRLQQLPKQRTARHRQQRRQQTAITDCLGIPCLNPALCLRIILVNVTSRRNTFGAAAREIPRREDLALDLHTGEITTPFIEHITAQTIPTIASPHAGLGKTGTDLLTYSSFDPPCFLRSIRLPLTHEHSYTTQHKHSFFPQPQEQKLE